MKKLAILMMFLFFVSFAYAKPFIEVQSSVSENGLIIEHPIFFAYKPGNITLHFHVYNNTGWPVTSASCLFHLYNQSQKHIFEVNLTKSSNGAEYETTTPSDVFKDRGVYQFLVQCNSSQQAGFYTSGFEVSRSGREISDSDTWLMAILIIPLILGFLFISIAFTLPENQEPLKWFFRLLAGLMVFPCYAGVHIILGYNDNYAGLVDVFNIEALTWVFYTLIAVLLIYLIFKVMSSIKERRDKDFDEGNL